MKKYSILAVLYFICAFSGINVQAAVYSAQVDLLQFDIVDCVSCVMEGEGSGTFDTTTNVLSFDFNQYVFLDFDDGGPLIELESTLSYVFDLSEPSGHSTAVSCTPLYVRGQDNGCEFSFFRFYPGVDHDLGGIYASRSDYGSTPVPFSLSMGENLIYSLEPTTEYEWQVTIVPVPAAAWFFVSGLLGVALSKRMR